ncbi:MAG TPA: DUF4129 domain-containing protein, partial [Ktedonobacterales bacterium]|nr:DUF4129 domain-containing protein [Ktedonobacterales bacterium]
TLETLPLFCWLLMVAAYDTADPNNAAMPFWWMWLLVFGVRWLGVAFTRGTDDDPHQRRVKTLLLTAIVAGLGPLSLLITLWLSPAARVFLAGGSDTGGPVALALMVAWFWWRGLLLARGRIVRGRIYTRFVAALGATIAALAGAAAVQGAARDLMTSYLSLLLALLLFAGAMGLTLAQALDASYEMRSAYRGERPMALPPVFTRSWLAAGLGLSLGLSLLALLLATLISRQSVRILAVAVGNIVNGLIDAIQIIITPVFVLIYLILNKPIEWIAAYLHKLAPQRFPPPPVPPTCNPTAITGPAGSVSVSASACVRPTQPAVTSLLPAEWLTAMRWGPVILIIIIALVLLARLMSRFTEWRRMRLFTEERTMLDAREIISGQLRRFFDAFRRAPAEAEPAGDDLAEGSVRRVYRDTLTAAAATGRARRAYETPGEYHRRITSDDTLRSGVAPPADVAGALARLTRAYEQARYGQPDPDASPSATPETINAAAAVRRWLAGEQGT